jgi:hypothetical protein
MARIWVLVCAGGTDFSLLFPGFETNVKQRPVEIIDPRFV